MRHLAMLVVATVLCGSTVLAQGEMEKVEISAEAVSGSVHMLVGMGGNIAVSAGPDGVLIVDDQFEALAPKIMAALATLGSGKPKFILNTHWHGDHVGGNKVFGATGTIVATQNVRKRMAAGSTKPFKNDPAPKEALPIVTFDQSLSIYFNNEEIRALQMAPGHTDGDSVIVFTKSNVVHTGDLFFNGLFPFIDLDSGGSVEGYIADVAKILEMLPAGAKIVPGHGPLADRAAYEKFLAMLKSTSGTVRAGIKAGKSLDAIKQQGLGAEWKSWAWDFISEASFIETLYRGLK